MPPRRTKNASGTRLARCPHCGNQSTHTLILTRKFPCEVRTLAQDDDGKTQEIDVPGVGEHYVASCGTCQRLLMYEDVSWSESKASFQGSDLEWPNEPDLHWCVPAEVRQHYYEALRVRLQSPNSYAVQIRRSLEALCDDRGAAVGPLKNRLEDLVSKGLLPPVLGSAATVLRQLGNRGAHHGDSIDRFDVYRIEEFYVSIIDFVYTIPHRIQELESRPRRRLT